MKRILFFLLLLPFFQVNAVANTCMSHSFKQVIHQQNKATQCWNNGNLACVANRFYAHQFVYMGDGNQLIKNKRALYQHYKNSFQNKKDNYKSHSIDLGQLSLTPLYCRQLGSSYMLIAEYKLNMDGKISLGQDLSIWQKTEGKYKMIADFPRAQK